jgi:hypothetical protein
MAIQKIFRSSMPSFKFFFKNGVAAIFMSGRYTTDHKDLEDELFEEVGAIGRSKSKNPFIYIDESEPELDTEALTPLELIKLQAKEEARAELLAEMAAQNSRALDYKANVSSTDATKFADSLTTTNKQQESMNTDITLQALKPAEGTNPAAAEIATRLAKLQANLPKKA